MDAMALIRRKIRALIVEKESGIEGPETKLVTGSIDPEQIRKVSNEALSKGPIREVMRELTTAGLLDHRKNRGFFIPEKSENPVELNALVEARLVIELTMLRDAMERNLDKCVLLSSQALVKEDLLIKRSNGKTLDALQVIDLIDANKDFHFAFCLLEPGSRVYKTLDVIYSLFDTYQYLNLSDRFADSNREHWELWKCISGGNVEEAVELLRSHIFSGMRAAERHIKGNN